MVAGSGEWESGGEWETSGEFAAELERLKREGSAFLVTGAVPETAHEAACRRFLGHGEGRRRLAVTTDDRPADGHDVDHVVRVNLATRSAAAAPSTAGAATDAASSVAVDDLAELGTAVDDYVGGLPDLEPGALRVCVDALGPLVDEFGEEPTFRLFHLLLARVRRERGLAHVHLACPRDALVCRLFDPLFDGVTALRVRDGRAEQRWRVGDATTGWLPVEG